MGAWSKAGIASLQGKTVVITGATSGIGLECAKTLAQKQARVVIAARSPERAERHVVQYLA
jgi:NAD(P)-dependent dehydrogenase (short-subunit alcohol dehydrogenase family)